MFICLSSFHTVDNIVYYVKSVIFSDLTFILCSSDSLQTETKSPRHGGESVAEVLRAHGVKYVFTLVGGHISPILVACEKVGIRIVDTRHEATAVFAADAVARLSGADLCQKNRLDPQSYLSSYLVTRE